MNPRVVLYAEGGGETGSDDAPPNAIKTCATPNCPSHISDLGVGSGPLRNNGHVIRGSMLLDVDVMRQALTFINKRPDFAIILIDADGDSSRKSALEIGLSGKDLPHAVGCAVPEFEAWLIADHEAVREHLGVVQAPSDVEALSRREAKRALREWTDAASKKEREARLSLATLCDLDRLGQRAPSFAKLREEIRIKKPSF